MSEGKRDYSLVGPDSLRAVKLGLAAAEWYHTDIPRTQIKALMRRHNGPALLDTAIWLLLLAGFGVGGYFFWGTWFCVPFFVCYGVLYGSASDSRWHESGHGTAFRSQWLNDMLYQISSFMVMREPTVARWSHTRHHTDTLIVGRDREIAAMRPPDVIALILNVAGLWELPRTFVSIFRHGAGRLSSEEREFVPEMEHRRVYREARAWLAIYAVVIASALYLHTILPLMYIGLPSLYGAWLVHYLALTQHAGLAEDVLDHRLNSRTIYMNRMLRFIYWNMNYHVEHHMFPMVPYFALPELHKIVLPDMPKPYESSIAAYREILPTLWRQIRNDAYFIERSLPSSARPYRPELHDLVLQP